MHDSAALSDYALTHLTSKACDHVLTSLMLSGVEIVLPPSSKRPNDTLNEMWTDHFLVRAVVVGVLKGDLNGAGFEIPAPRGSIRLHGVIRKHGAVSTGFTTSPCSNATKTSSW